MSGKKRFGLAPVGPHSRLSRLAEIDGRTAEGRLIRRTKRELAAHVGGKPSATQKLLIERAAQYRLRLAFLDQKALVGDMNATDERWYAHWSGGLSRIMRDLGLAAPERRPKSLADHIAGKAKAP